mgnify:FL=1
MRFEDTQTRSDIFRVHAFSDGDVTHPDAALLAPLPLRQLRCHVLYVDVGHRVDMMSQKGHGILPRNVDIPGVDDAPLALAFSSLSDVPFPDQYAWYEHRQNLDRWIETWVSDLTAEDLEHEPVYQNSKGREFRQPLWQILLHMFNHQTHHRGQVAQALDELGIQNDVSNLIWYLRD